jgi:hypothetical protein
VKKISKEEKKAPLQAIVKAKVGEKSVKYILANHVPTVHVLSTIDVLMDNLRRNYIENIAYPWDREPVISIRNATTIAISKPRRPKFPSTI